MAEGELSSCLLLVNYQSANRFLLANRVLSISTSQSPPLVQFCKSIVPNVGDPWTKSTMTSPPHFTQIPNLTILPFIYSPFHPTHNNFLDASRSWHLSAPR